MEEFLKVTNEKYDDQTLENSDTETYNFEPKSKVKKLPPQSIDSDSDAPEIYRLIILRRKMKLLTVCSFLPELLG